MKLSRRANKLKGISKAVLKTECRKIFTLSLDVLKKCFFYIISYFLLYVKETLYIPAYAFLLVQWRSWKKGINSIISYYNIKVKWKVLCAVYGKIELGQAVATCRKKIPYASGGRELRCWRPSTTWQGIKSHMGSGVVTGISDFNALNCESKIFFPNPLTNRKFRLIRPWSAGQLYHIQEQMSIGKMHKIWRVLTHSPNTDQMLFSAFPRNNEFFPNRCS